MKIKRSSRRGEVVMKIRRRDEPLLAAAVAKKSPFRIKRILVPVDFSDCSKKALSYAVALAKEHEATLTLFHAVPTQYLIGEAPMPVTYREMHAALRAHATRDLADLIGEEVKNAVPANSSVDIGNPAPLIVGVAERLKADVIVISTHGRTGFKHALLGSVTEQVVRHAPCPVLVVRERERDFLAN